MPKRSIAEFRPSGQWMRFDGDAPIYPADQIAKIIEEFGPLPDGLVAHERILEDGSRFETVRVPREVALVEQLESAAMTYGVTAEWQVLPTPRQLAERYRQIESAAAVLLDVLGTPAGDLDEMPDALRLGEQPSTADLKAVLRLRQWAHDHAAWALTRPPVQAPHAGDEALDEFVCCLARVWRDLFGRTAGRSYNQSSGRRGGIFARFVLAGLKPLREGDMPTEAQIADRIKKLKDMGKLTA
jgi:hypothetical protein